MWDHIDTDRSAQRVSVATDDGLLLLMASFEFLRDNSPAEVGACLRAWNVAEALRGAGPNRRLLVTGAGCEVTRR